MSICAKRRKLRKVVVALLLQVLEAIYNSNFALRKESEKKEEKAATQHPFLFFAKSHFGKLKELKGFK